jgi:hypothetical protein
MELDKNQTLEIEVIITSLNEKLGRTAASYAEQGIAVGCGISVIPTGILIIIALISGIRSWIALVLIGILGIILATGILSFIASRSGLMAAKRVFQEEIVPEMDKLLIEYAITDREFYEIVNQQLPNNAPLNKLIREKLYANN